MSVTVDYQPLPAREMGMLTIGQVLSHLQKEKRLVVQVLVDGQEPDLDRLAELKRRPLEGRTLFIETADPRQMAIDVLAQVSEHLDEADRLRQDATDLIQQNQNGKAMEKLSGCFGIWHHAQESVVKTAQLMRIDLDQFLISGQSMAGLMSEFAAQLRQIKSALENRDFVGLCDILTYEITSATLAWKQALAALGDQVAAPEPATIG